MNEMNRTTETTAAETANDLMNSLRGSAQTTVPVHDGTPIIPPPDPAFPDVPVPVPGNPTAVVDNMEDLRVIPKSKLAVETEEDRQKARLKKLRDALRSDKPMIIHPDGTLGVLDNRKKADPDVKTIPKSKLAVDNVGELMNSLRGSQTDVPTFNPGNSAEEDVKVIPKSKLAVEACVSR